MGLFYITGVSGSGKSAVGAELTRRGYVATDCDHIAGFYRAGTWERVERAEAAAYGKSELHWKVSREHVEALAAASGARVPSFLCGITSEEVFWDLFERVVCFVVDQDTLLNRLRTRSENDFGKAPDELAGILEWHHSFDDMCREGGALMINGTQPLQFLVATIINVAEGRDVGPAASLAQPI